MRYRKWLFLLCILLCTACTVQEARLVYRPKPTADPTAVPTDTPIPEPLEIPSVTGQPFKTDANGVLILDPLNHYYTYYITLNDVRIYEYEQGTFLDGVAVNSLSQTLTGGLRITFRNADGVVYGYGDLYTADGKLTLLPGENRIYAEIFTEVDVQKMNWGLYVPPTVNFDLPSTSGPSTNQLPDGNSLHCRYCGAEIPKDSVFCQYCGKRI